MVFACSVYLFLQIIVLFFFCHSEVVNNKYNHSYPYKRLQCKTCPIHPNSLSFIRPVTNLTYPIHIPATCSSINLKYLLTCTQCMPSMWEKLKQFVY